MCDFHRDCIDGDDENNHICGEVYQINGQFNISPWLSDELSSLGSHYMCDFSHDSCNWTASVGRMRWIQAQDIHDNMFFMRLDMSQYFSNDLVTIGQLRYIIDLNVQFM